MNGIFKVVVVALMAALFAAGHGDGGGIATFQRGGLGAFQYLVAVR